MINYEDIRNRLVQEWKNGKTQAELAKKCGISQSNIGKIIAGKRAGNKI